MRIRTILGIVLGIQLVLVIALGILASLMQQGQILAEEAEERRFSSYRLADQLRQSSDDLTRFARTYVATGDTKYKDFFERALAIRNGEAPRPDGYENVYWDLVAAGLAPDRPDGKPQALRDSMLEAGFTTREFNKLSEAQNQSDTLVRLEDVAMNALIGRFDDGTGSFSLEGEPEPDRAIAILHGPEYHAAKARIMAPIAEFIEMIEARTRAEVDDLNTWERRLALIDVSIAAVLFLSTVLSVLLLQRRIMRPIEAVSEAAGRVSGGDLRARANIKGTGEVERFSQTFDTMVESVARHISEIELARNRLTAQAEELEDERNRNEHLLLNVMPASIADRLKEGEETIADSFPEVSVLFSDIVGFTELSARIGAKQVVDILNEIFGMLDELAKEHGVEKIKTIGDCYMVVAGVPDRSPTHAQELALFALEMQQAMRKYATESGQDITMRTGIHTGTVVAGVVGTNKFAYDLWGDVVNIASRMESTSQPGAIQVSEAVQARLQDDFVFESRGEIEVKGKGKMRTWYLISQREESAAKS